MNRSRPTSVVLLFVSFVLAAGLSPAKSFSQQPKRPNVLFIMTDTQRLSDMGIFGNDVVKTPHLDKLAGEGVRFTNCHTQHPACMPARATVFTGRYAMAHGVWSNGVPLPKHELTMAQVFADHGYRTGGAGKFHFLPHFPYRKQVLPTMETHPEPFFGFQEYHLGEDGRSGEHWQWLEQHHPEHANKPDDEIPAELHNTLWSIGHTIDFMRRCAQQEQPFFAFCSFVDPHQAYNPPEPYRSMYRPEDMPEPLRQEGELEGSRFQKMAAAGAMKRYSDRWQQAKTQHYGEMSFIDDAVGRLVQVLDELNLRQDTVIAFVADHGDMLGDHWLWWKGGYHFQGCTGVPLFFNWPGHLKTGKVIEGMCQQTDVMPTLLDLAGIDIPVSVQGKTLKSVLTDDVTETGYEYAYISSISSGAYHPEFFDRSGGRKNQRDVNAVDIYSLRSRQWRFTVFTNAAEGTPQGELYDLQTDPHEFNNVWDDPAYQEQKQVLLRALFERLAQTRDPLPERIRPY